MSQVVLHILRLISGRNLTTVEQRDDSSTTYEYRHPIFHRYVRRGFTRSAIIVTGRISRDKGRLTRLNGTKGQARKDATDENGLHDQHHPPRLAAAVPPAGHHLRAPGHHWCASLLLQAQLLPAGEPPVAEQLDGQRAAELVQEDVGERDWLQDGALLVRPSPIRGSLSQFVI